MRNFKQFKLVKLVTEFYSSKVILRIKTSGSSEKDMVGLGSNTEGQKIVQFFTE